MTRIHPALLLLVFLSGCRAAPPVTEAPVETAPVAAQESAASVQEEPEPAPARDPACPKDKDAQDLLPGITEKMLDAGAWSGSRKVVMSKSAIESQNARFYSRMSDLDVPVDRDELIKNMEARLDSYRRKFEDGEIVLEDGSLPNMDDFDAVLSEFKSSYNESELAQYVLIDDAIILCGPHNRPYIKATDGEVRFSRNNCSLGRAQSRIEVVFTHSGSGMRFVRTRDMWGWIGPDVRLSPKIADNAWKGDRDGRWFAQKALDIDGIHIPKGAFLAGTPSEVQIASADGFKTYPAKKIDGIIDTHRALTREEWVRTLFLFLGDPYGWGGHGGWRDCSRLILDTARSFHLWLPRNSKEQAVQTSYYIKVQGMGREDKLKKIDDAAKTGIVLLHFPGHIMAYLGKSESGDPIVFHSFSEYLEACPENTVNSDGSEPETLMHVDRVTLSDLTLGENTQRTSFLDRITHISVLSDITRRDNDSSNLAWKSTHDWTPQEELLYSVFVERLFDYPDEPDKTWTNLGDVLRDSKHNILFNSLGQNEEEQLKLGPDCADLPYMLRTYFAWKRGLPMAVRKCSRGTNKGAPKCGEAYFEHEAHYDGTSARRFNSFANNVGNFRVHSGNARTALSDDNTDFYPVPLTRDALRPGTTYADPYGHLLVIAHYTPDTPEAPGSLMAVDAQPDGTITRKRFWRGNFLFTPEIKNVGAGFKAFRPIRNGAQLLNSELTEESGFVPYSTEQSEISQDVFYDRVEAAIHPKPLGIEESIDELVNALRESAEKRVLSVQNGDDYIRQHGSSDMIMPNGYSVFETVGPWEDFATPSRDMRLLIAIDAVLGFPAQIERNAVRYHLNDKTQTDAEVERARQRIADLLEREHVSYQNSAGEPVTISLLELTRRSEALEMAYHPADCNEIRWGAPENTDEYKTCSRKASASERQKMDQMRVWFERRVRPAR